MNSSGKILKFINDSSESDDEDSDNFDEIFYSASSYGRSSVSSIPWAEDAIKQNREEWDKIERIFYDEESIECIKNDKDLYREILELKKAFPHLRVNVTKIMSPNINISNTGTKILNLEFEDSPFPSTNEFIVNRTKNNLNSTLNQPKNLNTRRENSLSNNLDHNLRISSVPISRFLRYPNQHTNKNINDKRLIEHKNLPNLLPINSANISNRQQLNIGKPIASASFIRMPPIFSVIHHNPRILNHSEQATKIYISAQKFAPRRQNSTIILPSIENNDKNKDYVRGTNRSISAVAGFNFSTPFRKSFEKYFE